MTDGEEPAWLRAERNVEDDLQGETIPELFEGSADRHADSPAQQYRNGPDRSLVASGVVPPAPGDGEFTALTYGDLRGIVRRLAAGFRALGFGPDDRVAILADTRMEWAQADLALLAAGCVVTTVYTESSTGEIRYLVGDPDARGIVVGSEELLERVLAVEDDLSLEVIVLLDEPGGKTDRDDLYTLAEVHQRGERAYEPDLYREWLDGRESSDLASLVYTSGTTGEPKGVRLTHRNFQTNVLQCRRRLGHRPDRGAGTIAVGPETRTISFLPLAHVFERLAGHFFMFASGATVAYARSPDTLSEDLRAVRPNAAASVPRVYERIYDRIRERAEESPLGERLFRWAAGVAREHARTENPGRWLRAKRAVADRLVYRSVRESLGGQVEFLVSGGGRLDPDLARLFLGMGIRIVEGYGLTETAPVVAINPPEDLRPGTLGYPLVGVETRIDESVVDPAALGGDEEQEQELDDAVGELLVRGGNVFEGYWDRPGATERAFTDGWFRTGDVVERTADGYLVFRERLKQLLVLSTGKNVAPGPIEDRFATDDRVAAAMVVGDGRKFVGALLVPNFTVLRRWADGEGIDLPEDRVACCEDDRVRAWVGESVAQVNESLTEVERIKRFALVPGPWTAENGLRTPSMKKRRRDIVDRHAETIDRLYGLS
ncbi:MAG: long-chain fatty acid--CoA ligase [Salinirussus sp.]